MFLSLSHLGDKVLGEAVSQVIVAVIVLARLDYAVVGCNSVRNKDSS